MYDIPVYVHTNIVLLEVAEELDGWALAQNIEAHDEGLPLLRASKFKLLGQLALLEAQAPLTVTATKDVEVYADCEYAVRRELERLLAKRGFELDPLGHEIWMPRETRYDEIFAGQFVSFAVADIDAVLVSKARMAADKNRALIVEYLARGASERFLELAARHHVNLGTFL
jgi:hypothetical protein